MKNQETLTKTRASECIRLGLTEEQYLIVYSVLPRFDKSRAEFFQNVDLSEEDANKLKTAPHEYINVNSQNEIQIHPALIYSLEDYAEQVYFAEHDDDPIEELGIDIETYSSVDLTETGVYPYAEADDFEILLFAYSVNGSPVRVVDLASGEKIPQRIYDALTDKNVLKTAYNAAFERVCLSKYLGVWLDPREWDCTMVRAARLALPLSLAQCGAVLGLTQQKMTEGKALINYFSKPCKPTKINGGRTRNLPEHAPEKWDTFKRYNKRDVEVEQAIRRRVVRQAVTPTERRAWILDQEINDRGVLVDMQLAQKASEMDDEYRANLSEEAVRLTGLSNPNSVSQLKEWLKTETGLDFAKVDKETVKDMLGRITSIKAKRVLQIRQELGKSSTAKYKTMIKCACKDNRVRGLFQFYGANRTGRFCVTGDHEVLTPNGWVRLDEWTGGKIACWNIDSEIVSFQKAVPNEFDYQGEMYHVSNKRCDLICTPNHKIPYWTENGWKAAEMQSLVKRHSIPLGDGHHSTIRVEDISKEEYNGKIYCPTTPTGFFMVRRNGKCWVTGNSGRLVQLQNLPQNHIPDLDRARNLVKDGTLEDLALAYGKVPQTLSELIRTAFIAKEGCTYHVCDFSAIEARVVAWVAGEDWVLNVFRRGGDIYCATASQMFNVIVEKHGQNAHLRQKGKIATLACGYGGGVNALKAMGAEKMGLTDAEMDEIIKNWRIANPNIVRLWKHCEQAARYCLKTRGNTYIEQRIGFEYKWGGLCITLPSKRQLFYPRMHLNTENDRLEFEGLDQEKKVWRTIETYGGRLTENIIQAIARDCLVETMLRLDEAGYKIVFHIHDETVIEATPDQTLEGIEAIFAQEIPWAKGLPLKGAGYTTPYYLKD